MRIGQGMVGCGCLLAAWISSAPAAQRNESSIRSDGGGLPRRVFASSRFSMDQILIRPYDADVPMGCVGARVWASSPQGWAFRDDVHWLYLTNLKAFDIEIRDEHGLLQPAKATYYPSHVHMEGAARAITAAASFTFSTDSVQNPLLRPFRPEKRWTCWSSKNRQDWYAVDFGVKRQIAGLKVWFFDDAPNGGCRPPQRFEVERWSEKEWEPVPTLERTPERPNKGENSVRFDPIETDRVRLVFRNAAENFYTGLYGFEPIEPVNPRDAGRDTGLNNQYSAGTPLEISGDKFITRDDVLVSVLAIRNARAVPAEFEVRVVSPLLFKPDERPEFSEAAELNGASWKGVGTDRLHDHDVVYRMVGRLWPKFKRMSVRGGPVHNFVLGPNETVDFGVALAISAKDEPEKEVDETRWLRAGSSVIAQAAEYQAWFDANLAYFDCSDPWVRKMYYHRAYNLRKNTLDPKLGRMQWPTFSEGRWRSGWYPNVISYGGGHQVREARWLRDPCHALGHLRTFALNEKEDGVYPSHVKPAGPQSGQYTDWITSSAWDAHLVHPDREFLVSTADPFAANVRGWQRVYDPDGDGLLLVDSHWWTGMEYQPSFFFFSNYKPARNFQEPESRVSLDRVDLTAYNFGNATAVARIYREIGQPERAAEFDELAAKIAHAVQTKMWDPKEKFFYSLRHDDGSKADVKEVIGVYPFYFDMLPYDAPEDYQAAWASILDPEQFWTAWPVASASKKCPAYSQDNWPGDGRAAGCMWNGPTWPHANSIVMTAMAKSLRASRKTDGDQRASESPSSKNQEPRIKHALWELFYSFTKAQYRHQDITNPWTGEFYHGESGQWKTAERDYHHSTWLDLLIPEILGLVPRPDDVLEVDPLVPPETLDHFLLDGQSYRGHDVTMVWDGPDAADHYGDGRSGFDIYLDGKCVASTPALTRIMVDLKAGRLIE